MRTWLANGDYAPFAGRIVATDAAAYFFSWGGIGFDLLIVPALLWRRTRLVAFAIATCFHSMNAYLFQIGVFPWLMIGATLLFFGPDQLRGFQRFTERALAAIGRQPIPLPQPTPPISPWMRGVAATLLVTFVAVQLLVPLRHFLYAGDVSWTEEGHNFAWHMKLRDKGGKVRFKVTDPATSETWIADQRAYLTARQRTKLINTPDMIVQFAHHLEHELRGAGRGDVEVRALTEISLNARPYAAMIDPTVDLTTITRSTLRAYILPLPAFGAPALTTR
jgi:hypothetical protein